LEDDQPAAGCLDPVVEDAELRADPELLDLFSMSGFAD
jgi:hypothetical protein